tara:strand:+ start:65 stop:355 length:291 start_codon:yes stop_codon:yes gene_type:complete
LRVLRIGTIRIGAARLHAALGFVEQTAEILADETALWGGFHEPGFIRCLLPDYGLTRRNSIPLIPSEASRNAALQYFLALQLRLLADEKSCYLLCQ